MRMVQNLGQVNYAGPLRAWFYSLAETFDVGRDTGTHASEMYTGPFEFDGRLDRVIFTVSDENTVPPRKLPAMYC